MKQITRLNLIPLALLALLIALAFGRSLAGEFVWDDRELLRNGDQWIGLSSESFKWAWTTNRNGHWQPLSWLSWAIDHKLGGLNTRGYHITNLVLHGLNAALVLWLALLTLARAAPERSKLTHLGAAFLAATLFAVHPLRVESVAWITERRDLLSSLFLFGALVAWWKARETESLRRGCFVAAIVLFALSLSSKAWGLTLPAVLLILSWWPLGRLRRETITREMLLLTPFALLALGCAKLAIWAQAGSGAMKFAAEMSVPQRLAQAAQGLLWYPGKTLTPMDQSPLYLLDTQLDPLSAPFLAAFAGVALITLVTILYARRNPAPFVAWALFGILVSPVLGFAQSGGQAVADRYSYLSMIPLVLLLAAATMRWVERTNAPRRRLRVLLASTLALGIGLALMSRSYTQVWRDDAQLWTRAIEHDDTNHIAWGNRGEALFTRGKFAQARDDFNRAIKLAPASPSPLYQRGVLRASVPPGDLAGALADFKAVLQLDPAHPKAHANLGGLMLQQGKQPAALVHLSSAIQLGEDTPAVRHLRGMAKFALGDRVGAATDLQEALRRAPADWPQRAAARDLLARTQP